MYVTKNVSLLIALDCLGTPWLNIQTKFPWNPRNLFPEHGSYGKSKTDHVDIFSQKNESQNPQYAS